jgi:hypothetical protein
MLYVYFCVQYHNLEGALICRVLRPHLVSPVRYPKRCKYALFPYQLILELVLKT